jgi:hypothetical protein
MPVQLILRAWTDQLHHSSRKREFVLKQRALENSTGGIVTLRSESYRGVVKFFTLLPLLYTAALLLSSCGPEKPKAETPTEREKLLLKALKESLETSAYQMYAIGVSAKSDDTATIDKLVRIQYDYLRKLEKPAREVFGPEADFLKKFTAKDGPYSLEKIEAFNSVAPESSPTLSDESGNPEPRIKPLRFIRRSETPSQDPQ